MQRSYTKAGLKPREKQKCHEISGRFVGGPERAPTPLQGVLSIWDNTWMSAASECGKERTVWMLRLLQCNREVKLLNNRALNIAGTNNRIREGIKSYLLGFGRSGRSQLLTHSPNKSRSGMSWC